LKVGRLRASMKYLAAAGTKVQLLAPQVVKEFIDALHAAEVQPMILLLPDRFLITNDLQALVHMVYSNSSKAKYEPALQMPAA
jgi:hypothetical protein